MATTALPPMTPEYMNENRGPAFVAVFSAGLAVAIVLVALRLWVRFKVVRKVGADDYVMLASMIVTTAAYGCLIFSAQHGLGKHLLAIPLEDTTPCLKVFWAAMFMTPSAEAFAKISISLMLIRITTSKRWTWFFYSLIVLFVLVTIVTLFSDVFQCIPLAKLWDPMLATTGSCNRGAEISTAYLQGVSAALYDIILATSPIFLLWNVQIDLRKKIALCSVLALGFFTSIAGILRTVYTPGALQVEDFTWTVMDFMIWKAVELPLSIIVGCLPTLRPLLAKVLEMKTTRRGKSGYQAQQDPQQLRDYGKGREIQNSASSTDDEARLYHDAHSIVKKTTWIVEEQV